MMTMTIQYRTNDHFDALLLVINDKVVGFEFVGPRLFDDLRHGMLDASEWTGDDVDADGTDPADWGTLAATYDGNSMVIVDSALWAARVAFFAGVSAKFEAARKAPAPVFPDPTPSARIKTASPALIALAETVIEYRTESGGSLDAVVIRLSEGRSLVGTLSGGVLDVELTSGLSDAEARMTALRVAKLAA